MQKDQYDKHGKESKIEVNDLVMLYSLMIWSIISRVL